MTKLLLAAAVVTAGLFAPAAHAIRPCDPLDVQCHRTCTLPQTDRGIKNVYFNQC